MSKLKKGDKIVILEDRAASANVNEGEILTLHSHDKDGDMVVNSASGKNWYFRYENEGKDWKRYGETLLSTTPEEQELLLAIRAGKIAMPEMPKPKTKVVKIDHGWVHPKEGNIANLYEEDEEGYALVPCKVTIEYEV